MSGGRPYEGSFAGARQAPWPRQLVGFMAASSVGAVINYGVTVMVMARAPDVRPQLAALLGIVIGTAFNFTASRYLMAAIYRAYRPGRRRAGGAGS